MHTNAVPQLSPQPQAQPAPGTRVGLPAALHELR